MGRPFVIVLYPWLTSTMRTVCLGSMLLASFSLVACAGMSSQRSAVPSQSAADAVEEAVGMRLRPAAQADDPALVNLLAAYSSATHERSVLVLVFDSSVATSQATGTPPTGFSHGIAIVRHRNVLVLYSGDDARRRARAIGRALQG